MPENTLKSGDPESGIPMCNVCYTECDDFLCCVVGTHFTCIDCLNLSSKIKGKIPERCFECRQKIVGCDTLRLTNPLGKSSTSSVASTDFELGPPSVRSRNPTPSARSRNRVSVCVINTTLVATIILLSINTTSLIVGVTKPWVMSMTALTALVSVFYAVTFPTVAVLFISLILKLVLFILVVSNALSPIIVTICITVIGFLDIAELVYMLCNRVCP